MAEFTWWPPGSQGRLPHPPPAPAWLANLGTWMHFWRWWRTPQAYREYGFLFVFPWWLVTGRPRFGPLKKSNHSCRYIINIPCRDPWIRHGLDVALRGAEFLNHRWGLIYIVLYIVIYIYALFQTKNTQFWTTLTLPSGAQNANDIIDEDV